MSEGRLWRVQERCGCIGESGTRPSQCPPPSSLPFLPLPQNPTAALAAVASASASNEASAVQLARGDSGRGRKRMEGNCVRRSNTNNGGERCVVLEALSSWQRVRERARGLCKHLYPIQCNEVVSQSLQNERQVSPVVRMKV